MDRRQRIALQRAKVREAIGILRGVEELFCVEDGASAGPDDAGFVGFSGAVDELEAFIFNESAIA